MNTSRWLNPVQLKRLLFTIAVSLFGTFIYAVGVNAFYVPHHFLAGGLTGISMIVYYLTSFPIGMTNIILNIPILILSLRFMGKFYTVTTVFCTFMLSVFIDLTAGLSALEAIHQPLVAAITGGVLMGLGTGLLFRFNCNTGGLDVIGAILKKYYSLDIGYVVFALNFLIVSAGAFIFSLELAVCTLIGMYITANVSNRIVIGFAQRKAAFIVSSKPLEVTDGILRQIHHGATLLYGQGGFSGSEKRIVFAIVDLTQITKLRHVIQDIDPNAFLFIMNTTDVIGRGFTSPLIRGVHVYSTPRYSVDENGKLFPTKMWEYEMEQEAHPESDENPLPPRVDEK